MRIKGALKGGLSERARTKVKFEQDDFDFFFQWLAGLQTHGGVESGEIFYGASEITDGDSESWGDAWRSLSRRVEARALGSLERGHSVSAREAFFRAYNYRRAPLVFMRPTDARYRPTYEAAKQLFRMAANLCEPPLEPFVIPFEGGALSGYMLRPDDTSTPKKTLLMFGGGDTFVEDLEKFEASREWAHRCVEEAQTSRKELIITPREEGADTHAVGTNLSLMAQLVFDWLDETFDR